MPKLGPTSRLLVTAAIILLAGGSWSPAPARGQAGRPASGARTLLTAGSAGGLSGCGMLEASAVEAHGARKPAGARRLGPVAGSGSSVGGACDACASWAQCRGQLQSAGASTQVVPLKNGIMYVYIADTPAAMRAVQVAVEQHHERLHALEAAGDRARLCSSCRAIRGGEASGRVVHEVLNIDGGCLMVTTSSDPAMVAKIYAAAGITLPARVKS